MIDVRTQVIKERGELKAKLKELSDFILSPEYTAFNKRQQGLLKVQHKYMMLYKSVLDERIEAFDGGQAVIDYMTPEEPEPYMKRKTLWSSIMDWRNW